MGSGAGGDAQIDAQGSFAARHEVSRDGTDPDLRRVAASWHRLPSSVRRGVVAIVDAMADALNQDHELQGNRAVGSTGLAD